MDMSLWCKAWWMDGYFPTQDTLAPWPSGWRNKKSVLHALHGHQWSQHTRLMKLAQTWPCSLHSTTLFDKTSARPIHLVEELTLLPDDLMRRLNKPEGEFWSWVNKRWVWHLTVSAGARTRLLPHTSQGGFMSTQEHTLNFFPVCAFVAETSIVSAIAWGSASQTTLSFSRKYC